MTAIDRQTEKETVRSRTPIAELVRDLAGAELESRGGDDLWACCPFHAEDTPSFHVRPRLGHYKCFGCGASGDVFRFVQEIRGVDFKQALHFLAERAGVSLGSVSPEDRRAAAQARRLRQALEAAARLFGESLRRGDNPARGYLADRGFAGPILETFDVGWVPADFRRLLRQQGVPDESVEAAGFTGAFANRISFGIRDGHGGLVGFGARTLATDGGPKYVNTRETPAFNKRTLLYGLDKAARVAVRSRRLLVMEGYTDVIMAHQRGVADAVASMGTSFTSEHARSIPPKVDNLVLLFDGDSAGGDAAERAGRLLLSKGRECRILSLPGGQDPCDWFASRSAEDLDDLLARDACSSVVFLCRREQGKLDPGQPGGRETAARAVIEACRSIVDPVRREGIAAEVALECGVDRNLLRRGVRSARPIRASSQEGASVLPVKANLLDQFVLLVALLHGGDDAGDLAALHAEGALGHPDVLRLLELAGGPQAAPVDPSDWIERTRAEDPHLAAQLEALIHPHPKLVLPSHREACEQLRARLEARREWEKRQAAKTQPDVASDPEAVRALGASLRAAHAASHAAARGARGPDHHSGKPDVSRGASSFQNPPEQQTQAESESW